MNLLNKAKDYFNLNYLGKSNISLSKAILIFYLIIASNFTKDLYSGQLYDFLKTNRYAKHSIGFVTMYVIMTHFAGITDSKKALLYSTFGYLWFVFTTKLDLKWNLIIIGLMIFGAIYESNLIDKEIKSEDDEALEEKDKKKIKAENDNIKMVIAITILVITVIGTISYFNKKTVQYGGNFDTEKYIFGGSKRFKLTL